MIRPRLVVVSHLIGSEGNEFSGAKKQRSKAKTNVIQNYFLSLFEMHILNTAVSSKVHGTIMLTQQVEGIFIIHCISHSVCKTHCIALQIVLSDELKLKASILSGKLRSSLITPMRSDHLIKVNPLTPKISLVILLPVCQTTLIMLVWRIWYRIN